MPRLAKGEQDLHWGQFPIGRLGMTVFSRTYLLLRWSATLAAGLLEKIIIDTMRPLQGSLRLGSPHELEEI